MPIRVAVLTGIKTRVFARAAALVAAACAVSAPMAPAELTQPPVAGPQADGGAPLYPAPPTGLQPQPLTGSTPGVAPPATRAAATGPVAVPATVLAAYQHAERQVHRERAACHLRWQMLAGIGQVESGHAHGGAVTADGTTVSPILGPVLDGRGFAAIRDTDAGRLDGSARWDRAIGPMQFIPSTWAHWGADGNDDGHSDPGNVFDAALATGRYLCAGGRDLADPADLDRAILSYNHSTDYLVTVRAWIRSYSQGAAVSPSPAEPLVVRAGGAPHTVAGPAGHVSGSATSEPPHHHEPVHDKGRPDGHAPRPGHSSAPRPGRPTPAPHPPLPGIPVSCPTTAPTVTSSASPSPDGDGRATATPSLSAYPTATPAATSPTVTVSPSPTESAGPSATITASPSTPLPSSTVPSPVLPSFCAIPPLGLLQSP